MTQQEAILLVLTSKGGKEYVDLEWLGIFFVSCSHCLPEEYRGLFRGHREIYSTVRKMIEDKQLVMNLRYDNKSTLIVRVV